jgi:chemotaxis protein MotB
MRSKFNYFILVLTIGYGVSSCVPARKFEEMKEKRERCEEQNAKLRIDNQQLVIRTVELEAEMDKLSKDIVALMKDTAEQGTTYRRLNNTYHDLTDSYEKLLANNEKLLSGNSAETRKLIEELNITRTDLSKKEEELKQRQISLDQLKADLKEREMRLAELQSVLAKKDSATKSLKEAVTKALLGFQNNGLTVQTKNGKVYVSMEEQLLFASGSTNVEKRGEDALKQLAQVLEKNKDINVLVEGHTDDVAISGTLPSGAKDNWELSVLRATSVTKIILKGSSLEPSRITAAGRGPYFPLDAAKTADARKKNRRTEIILSPKLDELLKVLETN